MCLVLSMAFTGCKKFLEVDPKSSLSEDQLFDSEIGFQQALTGVYSQVATRPLYGDNLSMGFASALAQNYAVSGQGIRFVDTRALNFASTEVLGFTSATWNAAYAAIAGANKVIINTEEKRAVLSPVNYRLIRGEALALRGFLHFEMLRMFGKEYTAGTGQKAIPYKKTVDENAVVPSLTEEAARLVLADLKEAEDLLKDVDPIQSGASNRRIKLNYYAVKALEARVRIYINDKQGALNAAKAVIDSNRFPFVTFTAASAAEGSRDRLYLTEMIFCIRVRDLRNWVDPGYFRFSGNTSRTLTLSQANFNTLYESSSTDYRLLYRVEQSNNNPFPSKFWQTYSTSGSGNTLDSNRTDQVVPVVRLAEMYYIMAETAATPEEGVGYLNTVRRARALGNLPATISQATLNAEIQKEYQKEFYAEGQLFFFYKRKNTPRMQFQGSSVPTNYVLPIPETEREYNPNY